MERKTDLLYHVSRTEVTDMEIKRILLAIAVVYAILPDFFPGPVDDLILLIATAIANRDLVTGRISEDKFKVQ